MARLGVNEFSNPVAPAADARATTVDKAAKKLDDKYFDLGRKELQAMVDNGGSLEVLGSLSNSLAFVTLLGNPLKKGSRRVGTRTLPDGKVVNDDAPCSTTVGYKFEALADVEVPEIDVKKTIVSGCAAEDVKWVKKPAGSTVLLTTLELFILGSKPEFSFKFASHVVGSDVTENGFRIGLKWSKFEGGSKQPQALPTPYPLPVQVGAETKTAKDLIEDICEDAKDDNGNPVFKSPDYAAKFGPLFEKREAHHKIAEAGTISPDRDKSIVSAAAARKVLLDMYAKKSNG